jgi:predicted nuclease of predicted toxin-antitoxin system
MKVRFLADYDFNAEIVDGLLRRESSIDIKTGLEAGLQGVSDPDVLDKAADEGRVLVTHDHRTMPRHFAEFISQRQSPGVFIIQQRIEIAAAIDELLLIWSASESEEWIDRILYLPL